MKSKRLLSLLLSLLMLVSMIPMSVFADEVDTSAIDELIEEVEAVTEEPAAEEAEVIPEETPEAPAEEIEEVITEETPVLDATDSYGHQLVETTVNSAVYPQCPHANRNNGYTEYEFSMAGATKLVVTFSEQSALGSSEYLEVYDSDEWYVGYYDYWTPISGASFIVEGDYFSMKLYSSRYDNSYGFEIESIVATVPQHTNSATGAYLAPTCTEDGYEAGYICGVCGEDIHGAKIAATGHNYVETVVAPTASEFGYSLFECSNCGDSYKGKYRAVEEYYYYDDLTDTMSWIMQDGVLYILGSGAMPDEWNNYKNWTYQEGIKSIVISEGITHIGDGAFVYEDLIESVTIPSTVASIGETAFNGMTALKSITLPEGLTEIGDSAFSYTGITSITIPDSVTRIGKSAFSDCYDLAEINFGSGLESIELWTFQNCTALTSVYFPYNVSYIGQSAFRYCSNLQEITFGEAKARGGYSEGLYLGLEAFSYCDLREVDLPSHTGSIDGSAFASNPKLTAVNVSTKQTIYSIEGPKYLTDSRGCVYEYDVDYDTKEYYPYNLVVVPGALAGSYTVPDCVRTIEAEIRDMPNLTNWAFGAGYGGIWNAYAFVNCPNLIEVKAGGPSSSGDVWYNDAQGALYCRYSGRDTAQLYFVPANATEYTVPADVNRIASGGALTNAPLKNIYVADGNAYFKSINGVLYNATGTALMNYPCGRTDTKFTIPASVTEVDSDAFTGCKYITDLYFEGDFIWIDFDGFEVEKLTIWYPADNDTWDADMLEAIKQEYGIASDIELIFKPYGGEEQVKISAPANVKASIVTSTGKPKLTWDKVEGAVKYEVWRATTKTGKGSRISSPTGTFLTNKNAVAGKRYYYYVLAVDKDGNKSEASARVNIVCDYAQPVVTITNVASSGKPKLTWDAVDGATSYKVYRSTSKSGTYSVVKTVTGTSYTDANAKTNKVYYYKVRAYGDSSAATSAYSAIVSRRSVLARPVVTLSNVASTGKIKVSWKKIDGAAKYQVQRATAKNGTYKTVKTTTSLSYTDTNATAGKTYYYRVKAVHSNTNANSAFSAVKNRMADLKAPVVKITASSGKPKVSWAAVTNAKEYKIYRSTSKTGTYKLVKTTTAKYWKDTTAKKGKTYYYKVVAVHKNSNANSAYSNIVNKKCTK